MIMMKGKLLETGHRHINRPCQRVLLDNVRLSSTILMTELSRSTDTCGFLLVLELQKPNGDKLRLGLGLMKK